MWKKIFKSSPKRVSEKFPQNLELVSENNKHCLRKKRRKSSRKKRFPKKVPEKRSRNSSRIYLLLFPRLLLLFASTIILAWRFRNPRVGTSSSSGPLSTSSFLPSSETNKQTIVFTTVCFTDLGKLNLLMVVRF